MILASAQTKVKQGDIESNLIDHYNLIDPASRNTWIGQTVKYG